MNKQEIIRYFRILSRIYDRPCRIILTGAALGAVYGGVRATLDIDFALIMKSRSRGKKAKDWQAFAEAAKKTSARTGIAAQYAEDIDRWSSITYLDYERHTRPFRKFGSIEVRVLKLPYWAIGKLTRYLDPDIRDLVQVLKKGKTPWQNLVRILGLALRKSPKSTACFQFRRQVEDFLTRYGRLIWGKSYRAESALNRFYRYAGIKS